MFSTVYPLYLDGPQAISLLYVRICDFQNKMKKSEVLNNIMFWGLLSPSIHLFDSTKQILRIENLAVVNMASWQPCFSRIPCLLCFLLLLCVQSTTTVQALNISNPSLPRLSPLQKISFDFLNGSVCVGACMCVPGQDVFYLSEIVSVVMCECLTVHASCCNFLVTV